MRRLNRRQKQLEDDENVRKKIRGSSKPKIPEDDDLMEMIMDVIENLHDRVEKIEKALLEK